LDLDDSAGFCEGEVMGGFGLVEAHYVGAAVVRGSAVVLLLNSCGGGRGRQQEYSRGYCSDSAD
jgi:hypothetical protein